VSGVSSTLWMFERGMSAQVLDVRLDKRGGQRKDGWERRRRVGVFVGPKRRE
jgi:hypothetical protein